MYEEKKRSLTICIPALNEADHIEKALFEVYGAAKKSLDLFEVIVVDDGSTDNTYNVAFEAAKKLGPEVKLIRKEVNQGIGAAFHTALLRARFENITTFPADNAYCIDSIKVLYSKIGVCPVILGYRVNLNDRPVLRIFLSRGVRFCVKLLTGKKIRDATAPFILPVSSCKSISVEYANYNFHMQLLSFILNKKSEYIEVPVTYVNKADSNSGAIKLKILKDVLKSTSQLFLLKITGKLT